MTRKAKGFSGLTATVANAPAPKVADYESLYRQALVASQDRDEQLALLAHELRNPLNALSASSEVLVRSAPGSAPAVSAVNVIARQVRKLADLIDLRLPWAELPFGLRAVAGADTSSDTGAAAAGDRNGGADSPTAALPSQAGDGPTAGSSIAAGFELHLVEPVESDTAGGSLGLAASPR